MQINNTNITSVHNVKNLGVIFNNFHHLNAICGKTVAIPILLYGCELFSSCDSVSKNKPKVTYNNIARSVYGRIRDSRLSECSYKIYNTLVYLHKIIYIRQLLYLFIR